MVNFNSIEKISQVCGGVKSLKIERNYSIKPKATEGNLLNKQSKGYFKCKLTKNTQFRNNKIT